MKITRQETKAKTFEEVQVREAIVRDLLQAERIAGSSSGIMYSLVILSQIAKFDGQNLPPEELEELNARDFLELSKSSMDIVLAEPQKASSSSQDTQEST
jgi:hypothetical protein